jgi:hypothetical protein
MIFSIASCEEKITAGAFSAMKSVLRTDMLVAVATLFGDNQ